MAIKPTVEPTESSAPAVIHDDRAPATAHASNETVPSPRRSGLVGRLLSVVRGDKYMADAYPPPKER